MPICNNHHSVWRLFYCPRNWSHRDWKVNIHQTIIVSSGWYEFFLHGRIYNAHFMERSALSCLAYVIEACGESKQFDLVNLVINLNGCKDGQSMKRSFPSTVSAFDCNQFCCQKKKRPKLLHT